MNNDAIRSRSTLALGLTLVLAVTAAAAAPGSQMPISGSRPQPPAAAKPAPPAPPPKLPALAAAEIADRNASARGGLAKWRAVQSIEMGGQLDAGGKADALLPYTMQSKRPHKQRLTLMFAGTTAVQVYDGEKGWKLRPYLGRNEPEPFSAEELKASAQAPEIEGALLGYAAKGSKLAVDGTETVDGQATYRLKLTTSDGRVERLWIDGKTFLEAKIEDNPRRLDGKMHAVETYYRDYHTVDGLVLPYTLETRVEGVRQPHKMVVEGCRESRAR